MKINQTILGLLVLVILFGGIFTTIGLDIWTTTSSKTPAKFSTGEFEGENNPADIRGSYSFADVSEHFDIPTSVLFEAFGMDTEIDGATFQCKDLEGLYESTGVEIGNESVQIFVGLYLGLPIELDGTLIPQSAGDLILNHNKLLTQEQIDYIETHTTDVTISIDVATIESTKSTESTVEETEEKVVNGSATFQKVIDAGVTIEEIESILGDKMPATNMTIKDYCIDSGLSFSDIKNQLNALLVE